MIGVVEISQAHARLDDDNANLIIHAESRGFYFVRGQSGVEFFEIAVGPSTLGTMTACAAVRRKGGQVLFKFPNLG